MQVLQAGPDGNSSGEAGQIDIQSLESFRNEEAGTFSFPIGGGGEDHFKDSVPLHSLVQGVQGVRLGFGTFARGETVHENMVEPGEDPGTLHALDFARALDYANQGSVTVLILANRTGGAKGDIAAYGTPKSFHASIAESQSQFGGILRGRAQDMEGHPFGTARTHPWKLFQGLDEPLKGGRKGQGRVRTYRGDPTLP